MSMPFLHGRLIHNEGFYLVELSVNLWGWEESIATPALALLGDQWVVSTVENRRWVKVMDFGAPEEISSNGRNTSTALSPVPSDLERNCIYFTDNYSDLFNYGGRDVGVYSLDDSELYSFYHGNLVETFSTPIWVTFNPNKHNQDR